MEDIVSFIIPAYNNERTIGNCLRSILNQSVEKEIIVVDNGSFDGTRRIIKKFPIKMLVEKKRGSAAARNRGLAEATGKYIAFVDADAVLPRSWSTKAVGILKETPGDVAGCGGPLLSMEKSQIGLSLDALIFGNPRNVGRIYVNALNASGAMFHKKVFSKIRFDEDFVRGQDTELGFRMRNKGYMLLFDSDLYVYHHNPTTLKGLLKRWFKYGKSYPLSYIKHRKMRGLNFYERLFFLPVLVVLIGLSFFWNVLIYLAILQTCILFFSYVYTGLRIPPKIRRVNIITFSAVHTVKQLAQVTGIWFGFFERGFLNTQR